MSNLTDRLWTEDLDGRLDALRTLCASEPPRPRKGTNLHIHTNESFSVFRSPTEAVWQAVCEGVAVLGINDHYTVAGHDEFRRACRIARIPAAFSMEAVAMDRDAESNGVLMNDPGNPGRTYFCAKGVTRIPPDSSPAMRALATMRAALERRNREMTDKVRELFRRRMDTEGPTWADVVRLTPRGNATERHISKAVVIRLRGLAKDRGMSLADAAGRCCGTVPPGDGDAALQNFVRSKLLKAGAPCFVDESPEAFLSLEEMRDMFLAFGAIPTYPVLGNPVTGGEKDINALLDRLESMNVFALEVIPQRNTKDRLAEIIAAAKARHWPVFNGTEHNTPEPAPLLAPLSLDPDFLPWFEHSAAVLLGHHRLIEQGQPGFVDANGMPAIADPRTRFERFRDAGRQAWKEVEETL